METKRQIKKQKEHQMKAVLCYVLIIFSLFHGSIVMSALFSSHLLSPPATPLFEDREGNYLTDFPNPGGEYGFWKINGPVPGRIKKTFITIEDKRFYSHPGVDLKSIGRALVNNLLGRQVQGASTIPMQIARMQNPKKRTLPNKLREIYTAFFLTTTHSRQALLRHYLRIIPQGNQMHGVAYAARRYFRKPICDISWAEAALLTAVIKAPGKMNLFSFEGSLRAAQRARHILHRLYKERILTRDDYYTSLAVLYQKSYQLKEKRPEESYHYLFRLLDSYKLPGESGAEINYTHPVRTTLDPELQSYLHTMAVHSMGKYRPYGAGNISIIVADTKTGCILGYIGSEEYFDKHNAGGINYAHTPRSSGSTLKPFVYALGLETNTFTPASIIPDLPLSILSTKGEYRPGNFDDDYLGPLLFRYALANSRNIPAIRVLEKTGIEQTYEFFKDLGLITGKKSPEHYGYGLAVGGVYVTLEQLVAAYGVLASGGREFTLHFQEPGTRQKGRRLFSSYTAHQISLFLSDPHARAPSFKKLSHVGSTFPLAIKTGTSQGYRDAWAVAYNAEYIAGIWMGHPENNRMNHVTGSEAAQLVYTLFTFLEPEKKQGINEEPFHIPQDTIPKKICTLSGKCAGINCRDISIEYFRPGEEPHEYCHLHRELTVDRATGKPAGPGTPGDRIVTQTYALLPPEYAAWGVKHGYQTPDTIYENLKDASVTILHPHTGSRLFIDPGTPLAFQSIPLKALVKPVIPEIVWIVDGEEYKTTGFPYSVRWNLEQGTHMIQAKFPRAHIYSEKVVVEVKEY